MHVVGGGDEIAAAGEKEPSRLKLGGGQLSF